MDCGCVLRVLIFGRLRVVRATDISSTVGRFFAIGFFLIRLLGGNFLLALLRIRSLFCENSNVPHSPITS
jgi:hypothetical protein